MDRVQSRLQRLSMVVDGARIRLTPGLVLSERVEAQNGAPDDWRFLRRPALLGFIAIVSICVGASLPSSPFKFEAPGMWFFGEGNGSSNVLAAPRGRRRLRRHDPLHPGLVRAGPDPAAPPRGAHPDPGRHAGAVDRPPARGGPALQPRRVLLRRPGRNDEPPHQPVQLRTGDHRLGAVRDRCGRAVVEHPRPLRPVLLDAGRVGGLPERPQCAGHRPAAAPDVGGRRGAHRLLHPEAGPGLRA